MNEDLILINVELGEHGLYYGTSPQEKGLLVTGKSIKEMMDRVPSALTELRRVEKNLCQDTPEPAESKGSAQALPNDQSGPEKSLGQICHDAREQWWLENKRMTPQDYSELTLAGREVTEFAAQAVASKVRAETIEECCRLLVQKAEDHAHVAKNFTFGKQEIIMAKGQAFAEAVSALCELRSLKGSKANDAT
jgi:predicted RNase H-like HicB family nuclease